MQVVSRDAKGVTPLITQIISHSAIDLTTMEQCQSTVIASTKGFSK